METYGLEKLGIINAGAVYRNLTPAQLVEHALRRGEGSLIQHRRPGASRPGNTPAARPTTSSSWTPPAVHDDIAWGKVNRAHGHRPGFDAMYAKVAAYLQNQDDVHFRRLRRSGPQVYQGLPHRQRAGQPESVHPPAAAAAPRRSS